MILAADIERVRDEADIVSIIGGYVNLRRVGSSFRGPCPFHQGTNRNFSVGNRKGFAYWRCFVCGEGGDVFKFLQQHLGVDFPTSVRMVAEASGVVLREEGPREPDPRDPLWEVNGAAAEFFATELRGAGGAPARDYLAKRSLTLDDAERFEIGWAAPYNRLPDRLRTLGFDDARQIAAGVLVENEEHGTKRPRFRGRLTFAIRDGSGHLAGFAGRLIGAGEPKYLNSSDSPAFRKGELLYGLHAARAAIRKAGRILIVEGYLDVIRPVLAGIAEVVAPMGTALTPAQATMIRRLTSTAYLVYDSDEGGAEATYRNGEILLAAGVAVRVVTLPKGEDPDSFVLAHGPEALERAIAKSVDLFDKKIQILTDAGFFADISGKQEAFAKLASTITAAADPLVRGLYVARAAEVLSISEDAVNEALNAVRRRR